MRQALNNLTAIVDYAHTPDALDNVLKTINDLKEGDVQVITVLGCGGDRDVSKRPIMAEIAARLSDKVIFTADNPRSEEPAEIIEEIIGQGLFSLKILTALLQAF